MRLLGRYLKDQIRYIIMYVGFVSIFAAVFWLYDGRFGVIRYAFLLSLIWIAGCEGIGFLRYYRTHIRLTDIAQTVTSEWSSLPDAGSLLEEDYQGMMEALYNSKMNAESEAGIARRDMVDYYSLWAHQIKTPISAMRVMLQSEEESRVEREAQLQEALLERKELSKLITNEGGQQWTKELRMELFKIEQYVEMVLCYLRVEEMSSDMVLGKYELDNIIRQAVRKYSQLFILQKLKLSYEPLGVKVLTDEKWLVFVLEQILSNALKYTPKGTISIYMRDAARKQLVIEDTGIGIWPEDLPRVFEKGFTGYNGRIHKKSTGIGLYLCKNVMNKLGHGIEIEFTAAKGTRVVLTLARPELWTE